MTGAKVALAFLLAGIPALLTAQTPAYPPPPPPTDTAPPPPSPPPAAAPAPAINFSGVLYANYQYRVDDGPAQSANKFDVERAYFTFRMAAGERASVRLTADVFQQQTTGADAFYRGWVIRAKYAFLQYDLLKGAEWNALVRGGLLHTVVIEHVETFWPRWISITPVERAGFFSSADGGIAGLITLPNRLGEIYTTITNGPGYTSRETDRFKDFAGRISLTPFGGGENFLKTFTLTGWTYRGAIASRFVAGGTGQVGPIGESLPRNRSGVFVGIRDPRVTIGAEYATRTDGSEVGDNTLLVPRSEVDSTGRLISGFTVIRPFQLLNEKSSIPLGLVARWDRFKPNTDADPYSNIVIAGVIWDINKRASLALDYQEQTPHGGPVLVPSKIYFLHLVANY